MRSEIAVSFQDVAFRYGSLTVLSGVSFEIPKGEFVAVIGPNGGGKTTLLKLMLGIFEPSGGNIAILGEKSVCASKRVGYVPQDTNRNKGFPVNVMDVALMGRVGRGRSVNEEDIMYARKALERMGIWDIRNALIGAISQGQRQRVLIARALSCDPEIMLLDEPTASVDIKTQDNLFRILKEINDTVTIIVVSHDLSVISGNASSVLCVNRGAYYHDEGELTPGMIGMAYGSCPVELIAHGIPHRVLASHSHEEDAENV